MSRHSLPPIPAAPLPEAQCVLRWERLRRFAKATGLCLQVLEVRNVFVLTEGDETGKVVVTTTNLATVEKVLVYFRRFEAKASQEAVMVQ